MPSFMKKLQISSVKFNQIIVNEAEGRISCHLMKRIPRESSELL